MVSVEKAFIALFLIVLAAYLYNLFFRPSSYEEGFVPLLPASTSASSHLLDYYPNLDPTGKLGEKGSNQLWWHYPTFKVGSYDQITNNIRYPNNPDVGQCQPDSMCNVMYGDRQEKTNYYEAPTPPPAGKVRVGFYNTDTPAFY